MNVWDIFATDRFMGLETGPAGLWLNAGSYANSSAGRDNLCKPGFLTAFGYEQLTCAV
jgi:hypothetical protein